MDQAGAGAKSSSGPAPPVLSMPPTPINGNAALGAHVSFGPTIRVDMPKQLAGPDNPALLPWRGSVRARSRGRAVGGIGPRSLPSTRRERAMCTTIVEFRRELKSRRESSAATGESPAARNAPARGHSIHPWPADRRGPRPAAGLRRPGVFGEVDVDGESSSPPARRVSISLT